MVFIVCSFIAFKIALILNVLICLKKGYTGQSFILFPHHTCLCEFDSKSYCSELVRMKVKKSGDWERGKLSLKKSSLDNEVRLKSPFSGSCTYVADALFLTSIFQENVAEITGVNLFT